MNKVYLKSYFKDKEQYKKQYGKYITNSYSILILNTDLEKNNFLTKKLEKYFNNFYNNFASCYQVSIENIDFKMEFFDIDKKLLNLKNDYFDYGEYAISIKELKKIKNLIKFDTIVIKKQEGLYLSIVIELLKNNEVVGYLLPCKSF